PRPARPQGPRPRPPLQDEQLPGPGLRHRARGAAGGGVRGRARPGRNRQPPDALDRGRRPGRGARVRLPLRPRGRRRPALRLRV
ncbi:MAG: hypothetical protein AVDCRST_MAG12-2295, partial [uncultured Rubrobacteraceae bacterium]